MFILCEIRKLAHNRFGSFKLYTPDSDGLDSGYPITLEKGCITVRMTERIFNYLDHLCHNRCK